MLKVILAGLVLACAAPALMVSLTAHELGTSHVVVRIESGNRFTADLSADAAVLLARLEQANGGPRSGALPPDEYPRRIAALAPRLLEHVHVAFDGEPARASFESAVNEPASDPESAFRPPTIHVRLVGAVPAGAGTMTWSYDLTSASYALALRTDDGAERVEWVEGAQATQALALRPATTVSRRAVVASYLRLGFTHILPGGLDHILFVLGLFLLGRGLRPILWQVSAFTVAHSITLGLALYGVISLPSRVVEPLIAVSIVYIAFENLCGAELKPSRVALVFGFGLLHGLGFAGALRELALPRSEFLTGLVSFNVGVEAGQLTVIGLATLFLASWTSDPGRYRRYVVVPGSAVIAVVGAYWTLARLVVP